MARLKAAGKTGTIAVLVLFLGLILNANTTPAQDEEKPYRVSEDGVVDWYTFSGFRRYHSECHVCHGPDGMGSTFAPPLVDSLKEIDYETFLDVIVNGRITDRAGTEYVMPGFAENLNVMCFLDDLYAYLKARSDGAIGRGRPKKEAKPEEARERDNDCLG